MRQLAFRMPQDSHPFVVSRAVEEWFGQRRSALLYPRGSVIASQEEKDEGGPAEEDFGEAMHGVGTGCVNVMSL